MKEYFLIYIHGYGSNRESRKFKDIKEVMPNVPGTIFEWDEDTNFSFLLETAMNHTAEMQDVIIVGDSTGANFAYQLKEQRKEAGLNTVLVMTSPLLDYTKRLNTDLVFSENLQNSLIKIDQVEDALIILAKEDEVLDFSAFDVKHSTKGSDVIYVEDTHRLENFTSYVGYIIGYIVSKNVQE